jgi:predicted nucleic acid-binding protein
MLAIADELISIVIGCALPSVIDAAKHLYPSVKEILDAMIEKGTQISVKLYQQALMIFEAL